MISLSSCKHNKKETGEPALRSFLEVLDIASGEHQVIYSDTVLFEAPNWTHDGRYLIFNSRGHLYKVPVAGGSAEIIPSGHANRCNNDHVLSPDGRRIAISNTDSTGHSRIYVMPLEGGEPGLVTVNGPSYLHGWSTDGKTLAYCAERNGNFDVYAIPVTGGKETRLTVAEGLDDGPDYSPDGTYIYFNSVRTGTMQIWRMKTDGSEQTRLTSDSLNDWFPHPSPDGKWLVFLSYAPDVEGHPANKQVSLRKMPVEGGEPVVMVKLFGGQGTINVPSWSPDSKKIAFVSYKLGKQD
ncbi:MAG: transporter [Chlorobi bacterium]|nr:transporter [Chlorobiota bacterium]